VEGGSPVRELGFQRLDWMNYLVNRPKLEMNNFTTFRLVRRDRDWDFGEEVKVVCFPRTKRKIVLGTAKIIDKVEFYPVEYTPLGTVQADGFRTIEEFLEFWRRAHKERADEPFNLLNLIWIERERNGSG
jgi:hypothetical protein